MARARIADEAVLEPIVLVARRDRGFRQRRQLRIRKDRRPVCVVGREPRPEQSIDQVDPIVRGIAGNNAVVVGRIALRFAERLLSAGRAAAEVRLGVA